MGTPHNAAKTGDIEPKAGVKCCAEERQTSFHVTIKIVLEII